jgi:dephospho-CoA kinase
MMLKVGLTGGIGSGKSYVGKILKTFGVAVYDSDLEAKRLMVESEELVNGIKEIFGSKAYSGEQLNRTYISERVFTDKHLLANLNDIVHPLVQNDYINWTEKQDDKPYLIREAAILFETGIYKLMDKNILVVADEQTRIDRVTERDHVSEESVRDRIRNQMNDEDKIKLADFVIYNNIDSMILQHIVDLHNQILNKEKI